MKRPKRNGALLTPRATGTVSESHNTQAEESQHSWSDDAARMIGFRPSALELAFKYHRRVPTAEELKAVCALYKADLLRLTLAGKHLLKRDKAGLLCAAVDEVMAAIETNGGRE